MTRVGLILAIVLWSVVAASQARAETTSGIPILKVKLIKLGAALPSGPCTAENVMDIEIIDGVLYECVCDHMPYGAPVCDWWEVTSHAQDPTQTKRIRRVKRAVKVIAKPKTTTAPRKLVVQLRQVGPT